MDFVYSCRSGENEELRYSIRSVVANCDSPNIWVVGYKPKWYVGNFIPVKDTSTKFDNINNAMSVIANAPEISENFVLMNDDFFILSKQDSIKNLRGGKLLDKFKEYRMLTPSSSYTILIGETYKFLKSQGIPNPLDYDLHTPMIFNKTKLQKTIEYGLMARSVYGNLNKIKAIKSVDVKRYSSASRLKSRSYSISPSSQYISSEDTSFEYLCQTILKDMFPSPSAYELV